MFLRFEWVYFPFPMNSNLKKNDERLIQNLVENSYCVLDNFFEINTFNTFRNYFENHLKLLKPAAIGHKAGKNINSKLRSDLICWVDETEKELVDFFDTMFDIQYILKKELFLPIKRFETQMAYYEKGSFYKRHQDRHLGTDQRLITAVFYLNERWKKTDGGELVIYKSDKGENQSISFEPLGNRLVIFLSELEHEVLITHKARKSFTTWFRMDL